MALLNKLLSLLPANGDKTKIGVLLSVIAFVQALLSTPDGQALLQVLFTRPIDWAAVAVLAVGLIHKYVKGKADEE